MEAAGLGISLTVDKLGNQVVKKLAKGWPAEQSGQIQEKVKARNDIHPEIRISGFSC